jgi:hypothetical protein
MFRLVTMVALLLLQLAVLLCELLCVLLRHELHVHKLLLLLCLPKSSCSGSGRHLLDLVLLVLLKR